MWSYTCKIKYLWPHAEVKGIELIGAVADIGANNFDIIQGNIEEMDALPYRDDYLIMLYLQMC